MFAFSLINIQYFDLTLRKFSMAVNIGLIQVYGGGSLLVHGICI